MDAIDLLVLGLAAVSLVLAAMYSARRIAKARKHLDTLKHRAEFVSEVSKARR